MKLAIFDIDNTLIAGDSDLLWGEFLCEHNYVDSNIYASAHEAYYHDYLNGQLDINNFLEFQLRILKDNNMKVLEKWRKDFFREKIKPIILPKAFTLINSHRDLGHELLIITATNRFLVEPIANEFGIKNLIACEPELNNGEFTGKLFGTPSYAEGKVTRLNEWLKNSHYKTEESWFYSDSHNDIPLLEVVNNPVAVNPDNFLKKKAKEMNWPVINLR